MEIGRLAALEARDDSPEELFEKLWMQQHLWHCLAEVKKDVEESTYQAFLCYVIKQWPIERVCRELGLKPNHVYTIKWRLTEKVAAKMRQLLDGAE
ncbi:MAG: hypothetical protein ACE5EQ_07725 [Phycisphaerae bacterium]